MAVDILKAQLVRSSVNEDWGLRLQGGADIGSPLCIFRVTPGSPAHRIGLHNGDQITYIEETPTRYLKHQDAVKMMHGLGDTMVLTVERAAHGYSRPQPLIRSCAKPAKPKFYQPMDMTGGKTYSEQVQSFDPSVYHHQPEQSYVPQDQTYPASSNSWSFNGHSSSSSSPAYQQHPYTPHHPHNSYSSQFSTPQNKSYQTYDLSGPRYYQQAQNTQANVEFHIAQPRLFEEKPRPKYHPPPEPTTPTEPVLREPPRRSNSREHQFSPPPPNVYRAGPLKYTPEEDKLQDDTSQSRTFKILRSLMANEETYSGVDGLPPPRSAEWERMKREGGGNARRQGGGRSSGARVKVFMPQQYNSPMGMYSPENVVESFQTQAEGYFDDLDRKEAQANEQTISNTAKAVLENENSTSDF